MEQDEAQRGVRHDWVLWTREDAHWFAPLELHRFEADQLAERGLRAWSADPAPPASLDAHEFVGRACAAYPRAPPRQQQAGPPRPPQRASARPQR